MLSAALSVVTIGAVVLAIVEAPVDGWTSSESLLRYAIAYGAVATFVAQQKLTKRPIVPWWVFRGERMRWGSAVIFLCFGLLFGLVFILVLYFQIVRGASAPMAGAMLLPFAIGMALMSTVGPKLANALGWRAPILGGLTVMSLGFALFALTPWEGSYWLFPFVSLLVIGVGFAIVQVPATEYVMTSVSSSQFGIGSAVNDTSRELGGALGVAVLGSLFSTTFANKLNAPDRVDPMTLLLGAGDDVSSYDQESVLRDSFIPAMQTCLLVAIGAVGVFCVAVAFSYIRRRDVLAAPLELDAVSPESDSGTLVFEEYALPPIIDASPPISDESVDVPDLASLAVSDNTEESVAPQVGGDPTTSAVARPRTQQFQRWRPASSTETDDTFQPDAAETGTRRIHELEHDLDRLRRNHADAIGRLRAENGALKEATVALGRVLGFLHVSDTTDDPEMPSG